MLDYNQSEFARVWMSDRTRRGVHVPLIYVDINEGNEHDAKIFSQIIYWHDPVRGKLERDSQGNYWLRRKHSAWFEDTRIKRATVRRCLERLKARGLIFLSTTGSRGFEEPLIRVNWVELERRAKLWEETSGDELSEAGYDAFLKQFAPPLLPDNSPPVTR